MSDFTASNGVVVGERDGFLTLRTSVASRMPYIGNGIFGRALNEYMEHLRDRWRAEEDERLGRWRWPENPEWIFYPEVWNTGTKAVRIIRESDGATGSWPIEPLSDETGEFSDAARAYVAAHPERKPWHDAKPGETWRLTVNSLGPTGATLTFNVIGDEDRPPIRFARPQISGQQMEYPVDSPDINGGRRIWPEDAS